MTAKKSARQHARERGALDGADAQALEGALTMTERERDEARRERDKARVELEAALDGLDAWKRRASRATIAMNARPHTRECVKQSAYNIACACGVPPEDDHE